MSIPSTALVIKYPSELPIVERRAEVLEILRAHQVVIVAGETGSGKSTQLPKFCLELGQGTKGLIGHTQPRRIAARSVAERVAEELGVSVGEEVGYAVRFNDRVGKRTRLKVMTDGILLNEIQRDRKLRAYETIIVDEAHERSLNIDFILGYLKQLLPERPDLNVIVTSATIDTARFAEHFADRNGVPAPIIEVSGRTYPVDIRYLDDEPADVVDAVCDTLRDLTREVPGDILVFASGEREIRDIADGVDGMNLPGTETLPLFARLSSAEQHRVFQSHPGRRVVIATNIAETSITVPGITAVIDPGTARISRFNKRTKVQRLPIEKISQASADQRAGRCGRVAPGVCVRLFAEDDYDARPDFTEPEILRTNLASVILQMTAIGLPDVEGFPFVEAPDRHQIADGVTLLEELGALENAKRPSDRRLTALGTRLARLPLDPTLGRMVLEAEEYGCVHEVMVVAAALSIQDVRERPAGKEELAAASHARFKVPGSDFGGLIVLWQHLKERQKALSGSKFRREVRNEYLHFVRIREWQDLYTQLRGVIRSLKIPINTTPADETAIHRSLLAGLLHNVGMRDDSDEPTPSKAPRRGPPKAAEFVGPWNARFVIGRGSVLTKKPPRYVMAAELVEINRLYARTAAMVQPGWIEQAAAHLVTRTYADPYWDEERGAARVVERVRFKAMPLVEGRAVHLDAVDRRLARDLFVLHALVRGEWQTHHRFVESNRERVAEVRAMEDRARRNDILVDEDVLIDFFDERIPDHVTDVRRFDRWWKERQADAPDLLTLRTEDLVEDSAPDIDDEAFPAALTSPLVDIDVDVGIDYAFSPGRERDGATFEIPVAILNRADPAPFDWLVPGLRTELVTAHIKALPKAIRRGLVPAPDRAAEIVGRVGPVDGPLRRVLAEELSRLSGQRVRTEMWDDLVLPAHLRPGFRITADGATLAEGDDLSALRRQLQAHVRSTVVQQTPDVERDGCVDWTFGDLPRVIESEIDGLAVRGFPAVIDSRDSVGVRVLTEREQQHALHWNGVRRLLRLRVDRPARALQRMLDARVLLGLAHGPHGSLSAAVEDSLAGVLDALLLDAGVPFTEAAYRSLASRADARWKNDLAGVVTILSTILVAARDIEDRLRQPAPAAWTDALIDLTDQLARLVFDGMVVGIGVDRLADVQRYLAAMAHRLDKLRDRPDHDRDKMVAVRRLDADWADLVAIRGLDAPLDDIRWQIEELRVAQFAQPIGAKVSVSEKRIRERLIRIRRS